MSAADLERVRAELALASSHVSHAGATYNPHALSVLRCAEDFDAELKRRELELAQAVGDLVGDWPALIARVEATRKAAPFDETERLALNAMRSENDALESGLTARGIEFCTPFDVDLPTPGAAALLEIDRLRGQS